MTFLDLAKARFSVRSFSQEDLPQDILDRILEAAKVAPTAVNRQPQRIYLIHSEDAKAKLDSLTKYRFGAPVVAVIGYDETTAWRNPLDNNISAGVVDAAIVGVHMMMAAWEEGVGSCWIGHFDPKELARAFNIPDHIKLVCLLPLGFPAADAQPLMKMHNVRRPLEETVAFL